MNFADFWVNDSGSASLLFKVALALIVPCVIFYLIKDASPQVRRILVALTYFLTGLVYVLFLVWPKPIHRQPGEIPQNMSESVGFFVSDTVPVVADVANIVGTFLLGLGVFSVIKIHGERLAKKHKDWPFSLALILSVVFMVIFGYWDYYQKKYTAAGPGLDNPMNWTVATYGYDFLFNGLYQQMESAMFSLIAFFILSAAYRAFRIRSIEATVLLGTALLLVLRTMTLVAGWWSNFGPIKDHPNLYLENVTKWLQVSLQSSSIRGVDFGVGIGLLAMALRLWLSLEKQGQGS